MTQSPTIEFGLSALATAYSARTGHCSAWDVVRLQSVTLRCVEDDRAARDMVLDFSASVRGDAQKAGEELSQAVYAWLDALPVETRYDIEKSANPGTLTDRQAQSPIQYDWQKRADLQ